MLVSDTETVPQHVLYIKGPLDRHKGSCNVRGKLLGFSISSLNLEQNEITWYYPKVPEILILCMNGCEYIDIPIVVAPLLCFPEFAVLRWLTEESSMSV
jgi:hypothetical protein